jgi:hypothetical protein
MSRLNKWTENFNAANAGHKLEPYRQHMRKLMAEYFEVAVKIENEVKKILGESGLPTWHNLPYHNFARKLHSLYTRFSGKTLTNAVTLEIRLAEMIRLDRDLFLKIKTAVENILKK